MNKYSKLPGDSIKAMLEPGEYVVNRNAVNKIGKKNLDVLNNEIAPRFENANETTRHQNNFKLGLARQMVLEGVPYRDAQARRRGLNLNAEGAKMNEGGMAPFKSKEDYANNSLMQREMRKQASQIERAGNAKLKRIAREKVNHSNMMDSQINNNFSLREQEVTPIDLQKVEVPKNPQGNADDLNKMAGTAKVMNDVMINQGLTDSQGRSPLDVAYGQVQGLDPENFNMPTDRMLTPAEQLMSQMNQPQNEKYNSNIDEQTDAVQRIYKENPLMGLESSKRERSLQNFMDERKQTADNEVALEYSPSALHNADNDGIGGSKADYMERQADRELLADQNKDIAMMNPVGGPKKSINPATGQPFETMFEAESYSSGEDSNADGSELEPDFDMTQSNKDMQELMNEKPLRLAKAPKRKVSGKERILKSQLMLQKAAGAIKNKGKKVNKAKKGWLSNIKKSFNEGKASEQKDYNNKNNITTSNPDIESKSSAELKKEATALEFINKVKKKNSKKLKSADGSTIITNQTGIGPNQVVPSMAITPGFDEDTGDEVIDGINQTRNNVGIGMAFKQHNGQILYNQKGGSIKSPQESASGGIGIKNHEARMMNNLKKIQGDKEIKDMLKRRVTNPEKYRAHIKARVKSGTMMSDKEVTETLNYFKKRNSLKQNPRMKLDHYQAGGMVTSTGDNMGGVQMDSRRLLNLANKRKSYGK